MYKGKHTRKRELKKGALVKVAALSALVAVLMCGVIGGSIAWLITSTDPVVNTFTYGDINIKLEETDTNKDGDNNPNTNTYPMIPGHTVTKDPKVTVLANSEDSWLFVKLVETGGDVTVGQTTYGFSDYLEYTVNAVNWTALAGHPGVYYREVTKSDVDSLPIQVLTDDAVKVKQTVTKEMLNALDKDANGQPLNPAKYPVLTVTAYAVQRDGNIATAADAWALIEPPVTP